MFSLSRDRRTTEYIGGFPPYTGTMVTYTGRGVGSWAKAARCARQSSSSEAFGYCSVAGKAGGDDI